jgi:hypothetical protein
MKKMSKRAMLILLTAMLALSMIPLMPAHAVSVDYFEDDDGFVITDGSKGDEVHVFGSGVTAGVDVNLYWDAVKAWDGQKGLLNSTEAEPSGDFEVWFDVPAAVAGNHYLWVKDTDTGNTASLVFVVLPKITVSPSSGLIGDKITIKGNGFGDEVDVVLIQWDYGGYATALVISPATPATDEVGYWTATFKVPSGYAYGDWYIYARDEDTNADDVKFTIGASISFDVEEGPVGTIVEVSGRGFQAGQIISNGEVWLEDGATNINCYIFDAPVNVQSDGDIDLEFVIPQVSKAEEDYDIYITDGVRTADESFEVLGLAEIEVEPEYGVQGAKVTIHGYNFTQKSGVDVIIELWDDYPGGTKEADIKDLETDSNGEFTSSLTVPAVSSGNYELVAYTEDPYNIDADSEFRVGMIIVILSPASGPSGTKVTMTGTGFTPDKEWNATFGDWTLIEDGDVQSDADLELAGEIPTFFVPTADPGTYVITVMDIETEIEVDVEFEVTETTDVWTEPEMAPNEYNLTIKGLYFSEEDDVDLSFLLYNVTADGEVDEEWDLTGEVEYDGVAVVTFEKNGNFTGYWEVYDDDTLSLGDYWINVTDDNDLWAKVRFTLVEKTVDIEPRKLSFAVGDTVHFNIESSFRKEDSYIEVMAPDGDLYWQTDSFVKAIWIKVGTVYRVPYYEQTAGGNPMTLEDVPLGTWSWTWYDEDDDEIDAGTFTVTEAPADILAEQLTTLTEDFAGLSEDFAGLSQDVTGLSSNVAALSADVSAAAAAAQAANNAVTNLAQTVGDIAQTAVSAKTAADAAKTAADAAKTSADDARTAASGLTTLVYGAIGASLVAALAAIVSLMQISRRIAG